MLALMQACFQIWFSGIAKYSVGFGRLAIWCFGFGNGFFIAAGGYIINNIVDVETDTENKPENVIVGKFISETKAYGILGLPLLAWRWGFIWRI